MTHFQSIYASLIGSEIDKLSPYEKTSQLEYRSYARIRQLMQNELPNKSLSVDGKIIKNEKNQYKFNKIFDSQSSNKQCFECIILPMMDNVMKGHDSILITFGQTGSGKTYSVLGKPKLNICGILQMTLTHLTKKQKNIQKVELSAIEVFGHNAKISLFDLFNDENQTKEWNEKQGPIHMDCSKATKVIINDENDIHSNIEYAVSAAHFASTGTNIDSSRGHIVYIISITLQSVQQQHITPVSHFIIIDSGGTDGETAFTPQFKSNVSKAQLVCRRLEAGVINIGLSQIQIILNEWGKNGKLKIIGNGIRSILYPFVNTKTFISVLFTLSASKTNFKSTHYTLRLADAFHINTNISTSPDSPLSNKQELIVFGYCHSIKITNNHDDNNIPNDIIFSILKFYKLNVSVIKNPKKFNHLRLYLRVRPLMPWEPRKVSVQILTINTIRNKTRKTCNEYRLHRVFGTDMDNNKIFEVMVKQMIHHVVSGFSSILIGYGQRGSGKTFTLIGNRKLGVSGLLTLIINELSCNQNVSKLELSAVEIFGNNATKIQIFDLLDRVNNDKCWKNKKGESSLNLNNAIKVCLTTNNVDIDKIINDAHKSAHFASNGKYPESIRGHIVFMITVHQNCFVSNFLIVDCCGPGSESSFATEFTSNIDKNELIQRRMEYKCINIGLTGLNEMLNELKTKNKLKKSIGTGLRRILYPYVASMNTKFSVLFAISPAVNCAKATEATLKFAVDINRTTSNQSWCW